MSCTFTAEYLGRTWLICCGGSFESAGHYGSQPQVVGCSATVGNPKELAEGLLGTGGRAGGRGRQWAG